MENNIGILTLPHNRNYGGMIQSVALSHALLQMGYNTVLLKRKKNLSRFKRLMHAILRHVPFQNIDDIRSREVEQRFHLKFLRNHFSRITPEIRSNRAMIDSVAKFKLSGVVVGSDQVWRMSYIPGGCVENFFLDFVQAPAVRKVAYAASFGFNKWEDDQSLPTISALLAKFDAVSVREESAVEVCRRSLGYDRAVHVLDPTMLLDRQFYANLAAPPAPKDGKVVLNYLLDDTPAYATILAALGQEYEPRRMSSSAPGEISNLDLPHWLSAFRDADFVVTDSFHGTVFSILFEKQFIAIVNHARGADRFYSLLRRLGLEDRLMEGDNTTRAEDVLKTSVDYKKVAGKLAELREHSIDFIKAALSRS